MVEDVEQSYCLVQQKHVLFETVSSKLPVPPDTPAVTAKELGLIVKSCKDCAKRIKQQIKTMKLYRSQQQKSGHVLISLRCSVLKSAAS